MAVLQSTNVQGTLCVNGVAVGGGKDFKYCCFTASSTWTPTQDLVDGNGFIHADIVGAGGGGPARGTAAQYVTTFCKIDNGGASTCAGIGGFIVDPALTIDSTDACTVTVGTGGQSGSVTWEGCITTSGTGTSLDSCLTLASANITPASAGGNSAFGGYTAYGGNGGATRVYVCTQNNFCACCFEAGASSSDPAYGGCSGVSSGKISYRQLASVDDTSGYRGTPWNDSASYTANNLIECSQYGRTELPEPGASGIGCSMGWCYGCGTNYKCQVQTTLGGYAFCNCVTACFVRDRNCVEETKARIYGSPSAGGSLCYRFTGGNQYAVIQSSSFGTGADGIVVLRWQE